MTEPEHGNSIVVSARNRPPGRRWLHGGLAGAALAVLVTQPASALIMTPYGDYIAMSEQQQVEIVTSTVFEMIYYFNNVKHDPDKANCVGEYFSGTMDDESGGYYHFQQGLDALGERHQNGTLGKGEESYVQRIILKLIKDKCGV
jgi:hypothetical protein